jgi:hypothetical protein
MGDDFSGIDRQVDPDPIPVVNGRRSLSREALESAVNVYDITKADIRRGVAGLLSCGGPYPIGHRGARLLDLGSEAL